MRFQIPVGDWSNDGHGKCKYYQCESNGDIYDVREAYWGLSKLLGFDFHKMCDEYEDSHLKLHELTALSKLGLLDNDDLDYYSEGNGIDPDQFVEILVAGLNIVNPKLDITITADNQIPKLIGSEPGDRRHIGQLGYGLFWS